MTILKILTSWYAITGYAHIYLWFCESKKANYTKNDIFRWKYLYTMLRAVYVMIIRSPKVIPHPWLFQLYIPVSEKVCVFLSFMVLRPLHQKSNAIPKVSWFPYWTIGKYRQIYYGLVWNMGVAWSGVGTIHWLALLMYKVGSSL